MPCHEGRNGGLGAGLEAEEQQTAPDLQLQRTQPPFLWIELREGIGLGWGFELAMQVVYPGVKGTDQSATAMAAFALHQT